MMNFHFSGTIVGFLNWGLFEVGQTKVIVRRFWLLDDNASRSCLLQAASLWSLFVMHTQLASWVLLVLFKNLLLLSFYGHVIARWKVWLSCRHSWQIGCSQLLLRSGMWLLGEVRRQSEMCLRRNCIKELFAALFSWWTRSLLLLMMMLLLRLNNVFGPRLTVWICIYAFRDNLLIIVVIRVFVDNLLGGSLSSVLIMLRASAVV